MTACPLNRPVPSLAVLQTGHAAVSEQIHRGLLVRCLAHTLALLEQHPLPAEPLAAPVDAERLAEMAALLGSWKTNRERGGAGP